MLAFGICVGSEERYRAHALPWLERLRRCANIVIWVEHDAVSIAAAYNRLLERAAAHDTLDGLVLIHEDVELRDPLSITKLCAALAEPRAGVVGPIGSASGKSLAWWDAPVRRGCVVDARCEVDFGRGAFDVDMLDGLLLALSPAAIRTLRLPFERGFYGYDGELCYAARAAGMTVRTLDLDVYHASHGGYHDEANFWRMDSLFRSRWIDGAALRSSSVTQQAQPPVHVVRVLPKDYAHGEAISGCADLIAEAASELGCKVTRGINAYAPQPAINVVIGWHLLPTSAILRGTRAVAWQLEALGDGGWWNADRERALRGFERVWDFDEQNVAWLRDRHFAVDHVPVGYGCALEQLKPAEARELDVLMYGSASPRRSAAAQACRDRGLNVLELPPGTYGGTRDEAIAHAKCVLGVQYYPQIGCFDQVRAAFLVANRTRYIVEQAASSAPLAAFVESAPYDELADRAVAWCARPQQERDAVLDKAYRGFASSCQMTQYLESALASLA